MVLNKNALAFFILSFVILSTAGNLLVWLNLSGYAPLGGFINIGRIGVCVDQPPTLQPIGNQRAYVDENFTHSVVATNPSSSQIYYYYISNPSFTSFNMDETTGLINFTAQEGEEGNYSLYIWVTHDICGLWVNDSETITFEVIVFNLPPYWVNYTRHFNITEDNELYVNMTTFVRDVNNDTLTFSHNSTPIIFPSFSLTSVGRMLFGVNDSDVGVHKVNITVKDVRNAQNSSIFTFTVINVNDAPILDHIPDMEACEDVAFYYDVDATDEDLQIPNTPERIIFYDNTDIFVINEDTGEISFTMPYTELGLYTIRISVSDEEAMDYQDFSLDIIEVNDAPVLQTIGAKTVHVNESFNFSAYAYDEEDGDSPSDSDLRFNSTFLSGAELFVINPVTGLMNFTADDSMEGTYSIKVCVNDTALDSPHANATSTCNDGNIKSDCETFSLTILKENRAPEITSYFPLQLELTIYETDSIHFNVSAIDPDGTIPTIYWYKNSTGNYELVQTVNALNDSYLFTTDYDSVGNYTFLVNVSDGELSDFVTWNVTVLNKEPPPTPVPTPSAGGGGGGGGCTEVWVCTDWSMCQNVTAPQSIAVLGEQYAKMLTACSKKEIEAGACGFQTRNCNQLSKCRTEFKKPTELQPCYFSIAPSCYDRIRNCHGPNNLCEVLVDCGGPCAACPSCSDGIQNQGEEWIDCGGPCPPCPVEYPKPPKCGDKRCEINEIFTCMKDCGLFWLVTAILVLLLAALIIITRKEIKRKATAEQEEELKKGRKHVNILIQRANKAVAEKDRTLARHYYNQIKKAYETLQAKEKKRMYGKIVKIFSEINKFS